MDKESALHLLEDDNAETRLDGARWLANEATPGDVETLRSAIGREQDYWVREVLGIALRRAGDEGSPRSIRFSSDSESIAPSGAREASGRIVHEVDRLLGLIRLKASREIDNFPNSDTAHYLERLDGLLDALRRLSRAGQSATRAEFVISDVAGRVAVEESTELVTVRTAGPADLVVMGDRELIDLIVLNAVANAVEAVEALRPFGMSVVVTWGATERDYWVAVIDDGPGIPSGGETLLEIGETTKHDHIGMGLAIVREACRSIAGSELTIRNDGPTGTRFEFRWPKDSAS